MTGAGRIVWRGPRGRGATSMGRGAGAAAGAGIATGIGSGGGGGSGSMRRIVPAAPADAPTPSSFFAELPEALPSQ